MKNIIILTCRQYDITFNEAGQVSYENYEYDAGRTLGYFDSISAAEQCMRVYSKQCTEAYRRFGCEKESVTDASDNEHIDRTIWFRQYYRNKPGKDGVEVTFRTTTFPVNKALV